MNAYFDTLKSLMFAFIFLFLCSIPTLSIYASYGGIKGDANGSVTQFSLGNMGGASTVCKQTPINILQTTKCPSGVFMPSTT